MLFIGLIKISYNYHIFVIIIRSISVIHVFLFIIKIKLWIVIFFQLLLHSYNDFHIY